jgi:hypothetical protein
VSIDLYWLAVISRIADMAGRDGAEVAISFLQQKGLINGN